MNRSLLIISVLTISCNAEPHQQKKLFPWMENLVRLPFPSNNTTAAKTGMQTVPEELRPFISPAVLKKTGGKINFTEDEVITDEDVADDDDDETPRINTAHYDGKKTTITISTEAGLELYQHWLDQAVSGLMAAVATDKLDKISEVQRAAHQSCAKSAKTVQQHAKCVVVLLDIELKYQRWNAKFGNAKRIDTKLSQKTKGRNQRRGGKRLQTKPRKKSSTELSIKKTFRKRRIPSAWQVMNQKQTGKHRPAKKTELMQVEYFPDDNGWIGSFRTRAKRSPANRAPMKVKPIRQHEYTLLQEKQMSPFALVAKKLVGTIRALKNKGKDYKSWQNVVSEIRAEAKKLKKKQKFKRMLQERFDLYKKTLRDEGIDRKMMKKMDVLGENDDSDNDDDEDDMKLMMLRAKEQEKKLTPEERMMQAPVKLIRQGLKLGMMLSGQNVTDFDSKNVKMMSPRLLSLIPDKFEEDAINLLSPSLFALHDQGKGIEDELSLAKAMKYFDEQGHQEWLNFVIEASGVTEAVEKIRDLNTIEENRRMDEQYRGQDGQPMYFTKENVTEMFGPTERSKIETFEKLQKSLTPEQMLAMNTTGYAVMNAEQVELMYGVNSPYRNSSTHERLKNISNYDVPGIIDRTIRDIADETLAFRAQREHDIVLAPLLLTSLIRDPATASQSLVLSPALFVPLVFSPAIFGGVILSPWAFVPVIISPRVLSPVVLSPILLAPLVLSPLALDPLILSPGAFVPFVLNPLVLSPFILSPVVFAPLILSPFCLTPFIVIPNAMSPIILSPFVLSPIIRSPVAFSAFVLSPYALSPIIESPGTFFASILSPTWLS